MEQAYPPSSDLNLALGLRSVRDAAFYQLRHFSVSRALSKALYLLPLVVLRILLCRKKISCGIFLRQKTETLAREPFFSDIDLAILFDSKRAHEAEQVAQVGHLLHQMARFFPFLGRLQIDHLLIDLHGLQNRHSVHPSLVWAASEAQTQWSLLIGVDRRTEILAPEPVELKRLASHRVEVAIDWLLKARDSNLSPHRRAYLVRNALIGLLKALHALKTGEIRDRTWILQDLENSSEEIKRRIHSLFQSSASTRLHELPVEITELVKDLLNETSAAEMRVLCDRGAPHPTDLSLLEWVTDLSRSAPPPKFTKGSIRLYPWLIPASIRLELLPAELAICSEGDFFASTQEPLDLKTGRLTQLGNYILLDRGPYGPSRLVHLWQSPPLFRLFGIHPDFDAWTQWAIHLTERKDQVLQILGNVDFLVAPEIDFFTTLVEALFFLQLAEPQKQNAASNPTAIDFVNYSLRDLAQDRLHDLKPSELKLFLERLSDRENQSWDEFRKLNELEPEFTQLSSLKGLSRTRLLSEVYERLILSSQTVRNTGNHWSDLNRTLQNAQISVLIPTHKRPKLLQKCLESLVGQTVPPKEVVVVENGPEQLSEEVVRSFEGRLPVHYRWDPIAGISRARNTLLRESTGEIVAFIDDDCEASPCWLERLAIPFCIDDSIGGVGGGVEVKSQSKGWVGKIVHQIQEIQLRANRPKY